MKRLVFAALIAAASVEADAAEVTLQHSTFDVDSVTIKAGDNVTVINKSNGAVNVQVADAHGNSDDKGLQQPGESVQETFMTPGVYTIRDAMHPKKAMRVTVLAEARGSAVSSR